MTKPRQALIRGVMLIFVGVMVHSHAEDWALHTIQTAMSSSGTMEVVNYPLKYLFQDTGIVLMALGGIVFTLGTVAWLYPPRENQIPPSS